MNIVRRVIRNAQKHVNPVIKFYKKSHYGGDPLTYVISDHAEHLKTLTNAKTLSDRHIKALEELGFTFEEVKR